MQILYAELKKMFRPVPLIILIIITITGMWIYYNLIYKLWIYDNIGYIKASAEITELYGSEITPDERIDAENTVMKRYIDKLEILISENDELAANGVTNYDEYYEFRWGINAKSGLARSITNTEKFAEYDNIINNLKLNFESYDIMQYYRYGIIPEYYNDVQIKKLVEAEDYYVNLEKNNLN